MKINLFSVTRMLLPLWGLLLGSGSLSAQTNAANEQPSVQEVVGDLGVTGILGIFYWNLTANTNTQGTPAVYDQVVSDSPSNQLTVAEGVDFQIVFGPNVDLSNPFWSTAQSWIVFNNYNPGRSAAAFDVISPASIATFRPGATFTLTSTNKDVILNYSGASFTPVPEPTSALAGILLVGGLLRRRR